jgi:hypothetical protein
MDTTKQPCYPTTTTDASKSNPWRNSNKALNTTTTPSTINTTLEGVTVAATSRGRVELSLGVD